MPTNLAASAREYLGVPFLHQGRSRRGVDCVGLIILAARDLGYDTRDRTDYHVRLIENQLLNGVLDHCDPIQAPAIGCIALFELPNHQQHIAIVTNLDPVYIIHAYAPVKKVCEHNLPPPESGMYVNTQNLLGYYQWRK
jgi:hypothetical protein